MSAFLSRSAFGSGPSFGLVLERRAKLRLLLCLALLGRIPNGEIVERNFVA